MVIELYLFSLLVCASSAIEFNCPADNKRTLLAHPKSCEKFIECNDGILQEVDCIPGLHYNPILEYCDFSENVACVSADMRMDIEGSGEIPGPVGECPPENVGSLILLADSTDCTVFYKCDWGNPIKFVCPSGLYFDAILSVCDYPRNVDCTKRQEFVFLDPEM